MRSGCIQGGGPRCRRGIEGDEEQGAVAVYVDTGLVSNTGIREIWVRGRGKGEHEDRGRCVCCGGFDVSCNGAGEFRLLRVSMGE